MSVPYIDVAGTHYEIGCAIGEELREKILEYHDYIMGIFSETHDEYTQALDFFVANARPLVEKRYPQYMEELFGIASGAQMTLNDLFVLCCEESVVERVQRQCTTFACSNANNTYLAHNEDWAPGYDEYLYVVRARPTNGIPFVSLAYVGSLPGSSAALNANGIGFSGNSILEGVSDGIPKNFLLRSQIEARTLEQFVSYATQLPRAVPNHTMAIDTSGRIVSVEMDLEKHVAVYTNGHFAHTNHPIHQGMSRLEPEKDECSLHRLTVASDMLFSHEYSEELVKEILTSHDGYPDSICIHAPTDAYEEMHTIAGVIIDVQERWMKVAAGSPCENEFEKYIL